MSCVQCPLRLLPAMCSKSQRDDISFQLLLGTSASSTDSEHVFSYCHDEVQLPPSEVALNFYLDDGSYQRMVVEENLRAADLCHLLVLKVNVAKSHAWTLLEHIENLGIERIIEDHEDVLCVYNSWARDDGIPKSKFIFRQDFRKYEFFLSPQQFFPLSMLDLGEDFDCLSESTDIAKIITLQNLLNSGEKSPCVHSFLWCKEAGKQSWRRLFFKIEGSTLYMALAPDSKMVPCRDLQQHNIFMPVESASSGSSPKQYSFCLKACSRGYSSGVIWFCAESERQRQCWVVALRLARFGRRLRENYKEHCSRYTEAIQGDQVPQEFGTPMKSRVAMDFTGSMSRIVDDPKEAEAIAAAEGHDWKRRLPCCRLSPTPGSQGSQQQSPTGSQCRFAGEFGVHSVQPWFYSGMGREEATQLLIKYGTVDGVFLVRESMRNLGSFVLCYVYNNKVHHTQIVPVEEKDQLCFSVDNGRTKFYDLLQLVEFYQLNLGCLPTKLTHFLVHRPRQKEASGVTK